MPKEQKPPETESKHTMYCGYRGRGFYEFKYNRINEICLKKKCFIKIKIRGQHLHVVRQNT